MFPEGLHLAEGVIPQATHWAPKSRGDSCKPCLPPRPACSPGPSSKRRSFLNQHDSAAPSTHLLCPGGSQRELSPPTPHQGLRESTPSRQAGSDCGQYLNKQLPPSLVCAALQGFQRGVGIAENRGPGEAGSWRSWGSPVPEEGSWGLSRCF